MICYLNSKCDKELKVCSADKFVELTKSQRTAMLIDAYRSGENKDAKSQLPAFVFMGYDPAMLEGKLGSRQQEKLLPTGLVMLDFDHVSEGRRALLERDQREQKGEGSEQLTPHSLYDKFLAVMPSLGMSLKEDVALVHVTPSGDGLRIVLAARDGMGIEEMQEIISQAVGAECDKAVKDLSRLSFVPKYDDILYINKELLFAAVKRTDEDMKHTRENLKHTDFTDSTDFSSVCSDPIKQSVKSVESVCNSTTRDKSVCKKFPEYYSAQGFSLKYTDIVAQLIALMGGEPQEGSRNNTIFSLARDLSFITDRNPLWLESLIPTFGLPETEWRATIAGVCKEPQRTSMPKNLSEAIERCKMNTLLPSEETASAENLPPAMPAKLPSLIKLLTSKVLPHQKPAVASMVFPALATHVNNCSFKLSDNSDYELSLMCCLLAPQSVGKSCVKNPLRSIMADIRMQDLINRQREQDWQESQKNKKANEKGKSRPENCPIRFLSSDTTPAAFLGRLKAAETGDGTTSNLCTYSQVDEIEDMYSFCQSGSRNKVQQMIKRTWDRDDIGAERWTANAANIATVLRWNWAACSTIEGGKKFFKGCLADGTTSRVDFCTIIPPDRTINFRYGDYDEAFEQNLKPYIDNLNTFKCEKTDSGRVIPATFNKVIELENRMNTYINETSGEMPSSTWENYAWRTKIMVLKKLIVLYIANGCKWENEFEDFAWWSFNYSMWCKLNLFYDAADEQFKNEMLSGDKGERSPLKAMSRVFSFADFAMKCQEMNLKQKPNEILRKYKNRGYIVQNDKTYTISPDYCRKNGIPME